MYWLADILVGSQIDYRNFVERAHVERSSAFHRIARAAFRRVGNIPRIVESLFTRYRQYRKQRATADTLRRLSDHTLKDIGLTRGDIHGIASGIAGRGHNLAVIECRKGFVDQVDRGEKVSVRGVVSGNRIESNLPRAA